MKKPKPTCPSILCPVLFCAFVLSGSITRAEDFPFRVALGDLPGVTEVTSGYLSEGIEILEQKLDDDRYEKDYVLATLCGAYILEMSLEKAAQACTDAVEIFPGEVALINRGVLRAFTGDFDGARRDFDTVRPKDLDKYLEYLKTIDPGLIANENSGLLTMLAERYSPLDARISVAMSNGAVIESVCSKDAEHQGTECGGLIP